MTETKTKVLVVDDNAGMVRATARMLKRQWDVVPVYNVPDAIKRIGEGGIGVVLSDWDMPDGGGFAVMEVAHALGIGVVVHTGGLDVADNRRNAAEIVIPKPSTIAELNFAIQEALERSQAKFKMQL